MNIFDSNLSIDFFYSYIKITYIIILGITMVKIINSKLFKIFTIYIQHQKDENVFVVSSNCKIDDCY